MKELSKFILIITCLSNLRLSSQDSCNQYLKDFVPKTTDSVVVVNLKFHLVTTGYGGVWDLNNAARAETCIRILDSIYSHIAAPLWTVAGVSHITHARIKFNLKSFALHFDTTLYRCDLHPDSIYAIPYLDSSALNLFFVYGSGAGSHYPLPSLWAYFPTPSSGDMGSHNYAMDVAHEIGHMLGL